MLRPILLLIAALTIAISPTAAVAQHEHIGQEPKIKPPRIFLDKSPRVIAYQLQRLSNEQLLAIETDTGDPKYLPVFAAILSREGMSRSYRDQALADMVQTNGSTPVVELVQALQTLTEDTPSDPRTLRTLSEMLLAQPADSLQEQSELLLQMAKSERELLSSVGFAALLTLPNASLAWSLANQQGRETAALKAVSLIPSAEIRSGLHAAVMKFLDATDVKVRAAAIAALSAIPNGQQETFQRVAPLVSNDRLRAESVRTLLSIPASFRGEAAGRQIADQLLEIAEQTPAENRTEDSFLDSMQLVDELLVLFPRELAQAYRAKLREIAVRVIRVHTIEEEMRYDTPYFAVEAGRPVQVVLINDDLMPHNFVVTMPGALKEVADAGLEVGPQGGQTGKQYVPDSEKVLFATDMVPAFSQARLTFTAPTELGEYPYVCTFPRHWMRMYGVMVVVEDLDAWMKAPTEPKDPIGSNRSFVQAWTPQDFQDQLEQGLRGRSPQIGERIFVEATCAQCHKAGNSGVGNVGPELSGTFAKYKAQAQEVLREILDPSHRIDEKYAVHLILDVDGRTTSGLIVSQDKQQVAILEDPEAKEPKVIAKDDIEQMVKTSTSMMPKGLMDRFTKDEIFELLSFIQSIQQ